MSDEKHIVRELLERYGSTYAEEAGISLRRETPSALFKLLVLSLLLSARIRADIAVAAARALFEQGWTTPQRLEAAGWEARVKVLNRSGYARYDERTSRMLGETCRLLHDRYRGDLRRLRTDAGRDPGRERELLKQFKGIGDVGVDIFFREVQELWDEHRPFFDRRVRSAAKEMGLPSGHEKLADLVAAKDAARLAAALIRAQLAGDAEGVRRTGTE